MDSARQEDERCACCGELTNRESDYGHICECDPRRLKLAQLGARVVEILNTRTDGSTTEAHEEIVTAARALDLLAPPGPSRAERFLASPASAAKE